LQSLQQRFVVNAVKGEQRALKTGNVVVVNAVKGEQRALKTGNVDAEVT